jgi:phenylacetate-coenzyme A ligase PaaK-like adenylate-forming protein
VIFIIFQSSIPVYPGREQSMAVNRKKIGDKAELRSVQEAHFERQMDMVCAAHPYYIEVLNRKGLTRGDFKGLDDLNRLPLTHKEDWIARPDDFRLDMTRIAWATREDRTLWEVIYTAGSTADPTPFYDTSYDHYARISQLKRTAEIAGITENDTVINLFPLTSVPHQGYLSALYGSQAVGAKLISGHGGSFDGGFGLIRRSTEAIQLIEKHRVTVLWGIGFFLRRLIMVAQEMGSDFSSVRLVMPMGEGCPAGMRADIRQRMADLGASDIKILNGYGFTEKHGPSMECAELKGFHLPKPARYFFEFLDPKTLEPVPVDEKGLVVMTHLDRRGTCLLRYVVGDICRLSYETCAACGAWEPRFDMTPIRTGGIVKVKGTLVNVSALYETLSSIDGIEEYEIIVTKAVPTDPFSEDVLLVRIACDERQRQDLLDSVPEAVRRSQEVTPQIEFVPADRYRGILKDYKFKRFRDERAPQP